MKLKKIHVSRFFCILAALCAMAAMLFSGCASTEEWARVTIEQNYYRFDGDYSSLSNLKGLSVRQMVEKLDKYSAYYTREEYAAVTAENAGSRSGIGLTYTYSEGNGILLHSVVGNSPAKKAGLKAGDILLSASTGEHTVQFNSSDDFSAFVGARKTGEEFSLHLKDGTSVTLAKANYTASYASMYTNDSVYEIEYIGNKRAVKEYTGGILQLPNNTAYIYLSQFYGGAADEMAELIKKFNALKCDTLILDLRDDGGGYVDLMARIGGRFTSGVVQGNAIAMKAVYKGGRQEVAYCYNYSENTVPAGTKVYAMANNNTASASEALIGVLVSYDILQYENIFLSQYEGQVAKSYGKGIMQSTFTKKPTDEVLKLTVAGIYWAMNDSNGNPVTIHDKGLTVEDGCSVAAASDTIVNVGYDDELEAVISKIVADRAEN